MTARTGQSADHGPAGDGPRPNRPAGDGPPSGGGGGSVELRGVGKVFDTGRGGEVVALTGIDLAIEPGQLVSLIGPSGCGKSTLLRLIADLIEPTGGTVTVAGKTARQARLDQEYGIVFQQAGLFEWRTVARNVELPLELRGAGRTERRDRAREMLELVGLGDFARHHPSQLSGGMQQRVAIARALAVHPPLLLMDEPFGALDEMTRERLQAELLAICARTGTTTVFVTHSIPEAVFLSDRVVVMSARPGRITDVIPIDLGPRTEQTRQSPGFFTGITQVRKALRGGAINGGGSA
nr:ABC transporter ATP-binding protein [Micromonospora sp. DSM 115978]